ncbi:MAG: dGTP triphosphohydrolase, partial [Bacteroidota bacterium]
AQGFRLLNQSQHGLKLTMATLGAFTKYPRQSLIDKSLPGKASQKKFGFYQTEKEIFEELANGLELLPQTDDGQWTRHPLAFLVEAADDICYHIIDLEDGCTLGLISFDDTVDLLKPIIGKKFDAQKLSNKKSQHEKLGTLRAMAINQLVSEAVDVFVNNEEGLLAGSFDQPLTTLVKSTEAMSQIQKVSVDRIYRAKIVLEKEIAGFEVLEGLLNALISATYNFTYDKNSSKDKTLFRLLPEEVKSYLQPDFLYPNLRVMLDYISGMTDSHALTMYRKLKGMSLPSW